MHSAPLVALHGVGKAFPNGTQALAGLDLEIRQGEFVTLLGPSGCGKSTALRIIAGLSKPTDGVIEWPSAAGQTQSESRIGFVFQEPTLMPWASVFDNVLLPLQLQSKPAANSAERVDRGARSRRSDGLPPCLPARTVRRHADACLDRAGARYRSGASVDG